MEAAQSAVQQHLARDGQHDTTIHEIISPAITHETVTRTQHEEVQTLVEREVHQDHYHTTIQPIQDKEVLPEQHIYQVGKPQIREFFHTNDGRILTGNEAEKARFRNAGDIGETLYTQHVTHAEQQAIHHESGTVQPAAQRDTITPSVAQKTVPGLKPSSTINSVTMDEYQSYGGTLGRYGKGGLEGVFRYGSQSHRGSLESNHPGRTIKIPGADGKSGLNSKVGPEKGAVSGSLANQKNLDGTSEGKSKVEISDGHGIATIKGTETRGAYALASGSTVSPMLHTTTGLIPRSAGAPPAPRTSIGSDVQGSTPHPNQSPSNPATKASQPRNSIGLTRPSSDANRYAYEAEASPKHKEGLISKIKHAMKH